MSDAIPTKVGYVVWPEGLPDRAKWHRSWMAMQWAMLKPSNIFLMRRMTCAYPEWPNNALTAREVADWWEGALQSARRYA